MFLRQSIVLLILVLETVSQHDYYYNSYEKLKKWKSLSYSQYSQSIRYNWPKQENLWEKPEDDQWNFGVFKNDQCNKINPEGVPDQPWQYEHVKGDVSVSAYDVRTEHCCNGKTFPKYPNGNNACCKSKEYDTTREVCCDGNTHSFQIGYDCCGKTYIDKAKEICCFHPEKGITAKELPTNVQESKDARLFTQCCGEQVYDTRSHLCFLVTSFNNEFINLAVIQKKYNNTGCCEGKPYDQDSGVCNETGRLHAFISGPPCVFQKMYSQMKKPRYDPTADPPRNRSYYNYRHLSPCGDQWYDTEFQICCREEERANGSGKIWNKMPNGRCCGLELYNFKTHVCCDGHVSFGKGHEDLRCCGILPYDRRTEWCCFGTNAVAKKSENGDTCCGINGLVYNSKTDICCGAQLFKPTDNYTSVDHERMCRHYGIERCWGCCSSNEPKAIVKPYLYSDTCCNGVINTGKPAYFHLCCGSIAYDVRTQTCCGGQISNYTSCCGDKEAYDAKTHSCCGGNVVEKISPNASSCCKSETYDPKTSICCGGKVYNQTSCCDDKVGYNASTHLCCSGAAVKRTTSDADSCCGGQAYDPYKNSCCGGQVYDRYNLRSKCCGSSVLYNARNSTCCEYCDEKKGNCSYSLIESKSPYVMCCGLSAFNYRNESCCGGKVLQGIHWNCCGSSALDRGTQLCCNGKIHDTLENINNTCCGKNMYDPTREICCSGVVLPVENVATAMCCYEDDPGRSFE